MADWLLVAISTVIAVEIFLRTPFRQYLGRVTRAAQRARNTLSSRFISDNWKELVLPKYASTILLNSILLFGCMLATILPVVLIDRIGAQFDIATLATMATVAGMVYSVLIATAYALVRAQLFSGGEYSPLQKLLHFLALSSPSIGEASFDAEMRSAGCQAQSVEDEHHVFVTGLARAGTTILMRSIYATGQFSSLTYADMPFVLAPNLWRKIAGRGKPAGALAERAHGDGILVNQDSPEALDEVFWQVFAKDDYVTEQSLLAHRVEPEILLKYRQYVSVIAARYDMPRYLSKNNNNVLRLESIHDAFPNSTILIPFRNPQQHAYSLLRQHRLFVDKQRRDPFVRRYMTWLGHYEFGLTHKPFRNDNRVFRTTDTDSLDYWLELWMTMYRFLLDHPLADSDRVVFLSHERFCTQTDSVWRKLCGRLELGEADTPKLVSSTKTTPQICDESLLDSVTAVHARLERKCQDTLAL